MNNFFQSILDYIMGMDLWEFSGLVFGLLAVYYLIQEKIYTWPSGIAYVLVSFVVFWEASLYGDFMLHIFFLVLNIYGWYYWTSEKDDASPSLLITQLPRSQQVKHLIFSLIGILIFARFLILLPSFFPDMPAASLPYWDSTTSILSITGMWLTARKKIDNWYYWLAVDVLATGIYWYKELYFYAVLYFVYIAMAIQGYRAWKNTMNTQPAIA